MDKKTKIGIIIFSALILIVVCIAIVLYNTTNSVQTTPVRPVSEIPTPTLPMQIPMQSPTPSSVPTPTLAPSPVPTPTSTLSPVPTPTSTLSHVPTTSSNISPSLYCNGDTLINVIKTKGESWAATNCYNIKPDDYCNGDIYANCARAHGAWCDLGCKDKQGNNYQKTPMPSPAS